VKLYLSSFRIGRDRDSLRNLVSHAGRAALVFNSCDVYGENRLRRWDTEADDISSLGFECEELDLHSYFEGLRWRIDTIDLLWVVGGNSFVLAKAMTKAHFKEATSKQVGENRLVYAGYSAGVRVVGPDLEGIDLMDDPDALPDGYPDDLGATTLGWVPWRIVPHWRSQHPEAPAAELAAAYLREAKLDFKTVGDCSALVIDGQ
jgi:dipeptidase E